MSKKEKKVLIVLEDICKNYQKKGEQIKILSNLSVKFESGVFYAIMGHSGSGKSTLINILGLIDYFDKGNYKLYDKSVKNLNDNELKAIMDEFDTDGDGYITKEDFLKIMDEYYFD